MPIAPGQTILNKYHILKLLGEGGNGRVWLAQEITFSNRQVAIKEPRTDLPAAEITEVQRYYQQELKICALLEQANAPNLVRTFTVERYDDHLLLVMAYMPGGDLANMLHQQRDLMPIERAVEIVLDILAPLQVAHNHPQGIVHRDIKPQNILFDATGKAYLGDWGLAQLSGVSGRSQLSAHAHPGSPLYMAPEQARSTDYLTPAADIYAVGCVLFEVLTSKRYKNVRPGTTARSLRNDVPLWLDQVISKALAEDPFDRYEDTAAMAAALASAPRSTQPTVTPVVAQRGTSASTVSSAPSTSGQWLIIGSAFVALLLAGLLYWRGINGWVTSWSGPTAAATALAPAVAQVPITPTLALISTPMATQTATALTTDTATSKPTQTNTVTPQPTSASTPNLSATQTAESGRMATALASTLMPQPTATSTKTLHLITPVTATQTSIPTSTLTAPPQPLQILILTVTPTLTIVTVQAIIQVSGLNIRSGPGITYATIGSAKQDDQLTVLSQFNNCAWLQVKTSDGKSGWIVGSVQFIKLSTACNSIPLATNIPTITPILYNDEFSGPLLNTNWHWLHEGKWSLDQSSGKLRLVAEKGDMTKQCNNYTNLLLQDAPTSNFEISTKISITPTQSFQQGGLLIFSNPDNYLKFDVVYAHTGHRQGLNVEFLLEQNGQIPVPSDSWPWAYISSGNNVVLKIERSKDLINSIDHFVGSYSMDEVIWKEIGTVTTSNIKGMQVGIFAFGGYINKDCTSNVPDIPVDFDYFRLRLK